MAHDPAFRDALCQLAVVEPSPDELTRIRDAASRITRWDGFAAQAEIHRLTPLAHRHLTLAGATRPAEAEQDLVGYALQHRFANRRRLRVLGEVLDAMAAASIECLVLKGAALAHVLYRSTDLRPFGDLDLLVAPEDARRAQATLAELGFHAPPGPRNRAEADHHHLPIATRIDADGPVDIEIHHNALGRDAGHSLTRHELVAPPRPFSMGTRTALAPGHEDMLFHLSRHAAENTTVFRLLWCADLVGYAARYEPEIRWDVLVDRYPSVLVALSLMHGLHALPAPLLARVRPASDAALRGAGISARPLSDIFEGTSSVTAGLREVLHPTEWWLRLYYGIADTHSVRPYRVAWHPLRVGYWFARRTWQALSWQRQDA